MIGFIADFHFYPRPHMEGDGIANAYNPVFRISTHALTWRATYQFDDFVFFHVSFLPTPSHGGRPSAASAADLEDMISTHALTWRATVALRTVINRGRNFYPRPHMEGDMAC